MFVSMALERRVFHFDSPPRGCINKGMLDFLPVERTVCCTKLLFERRFIARNNTGGGRPQLYSNAQVKLLYKNEAHAHYSRVDTLDYY